MEINLSEFRINISSSQNGEDGIINKLFELTGINSGFLAELGAWNGVHLSNTKYHADKNPAFKRLLIESDRERFVEMTQKIPWNDNNILLNLKVETKGENSLNEIFKKYVGEQPIALLSIDIDGGDLELFESIDAEKYRPAIVIIEYGKWQSPPSLNKLVNSFSERRYNLVHVTGNFIFVDNKFQIRATETIHKLIRKSGSPEYMHYFGKIDDETYERLKRQLPGTDIHTSLADEQLIDVTEQQNEQV